MHKTDKIYYCIDLKKNPIKTFIAYKSQLEKSADDQGMKLKDMLNATHYDVKIFENQKDCEEYSEKYINAMKSLEKYKTKNPNIKTSLLYKKRYLVQTLLGEKLQTFRTSERVIDMMSKIKIGDKFNLYDQTHFLTVKLTKRTVLKDAVKYEFSL